MISMSRPIIKKVGQLQLNQSMICYSYEKDSSGNLPIGTFIERIGYDRWGMNINTRNYSEKHLIDNSGEYGLSLPGGNVFLPKKDSRGKPVRKSTNGQRALLVHEIYHQVQYESGQSPESVLNILVGEAIDKMKRSSNPYEYRDNFDDRDGDGSINRLSDILTLEGQAQYIEDFARRYFDERDAGGQYKRDTVDAAQVLRDSGIDSPAVRDVLGGP